MPEIPTRILGGVTVPDTPLITKALDFAHAHCDEVTYNHVVRSFIFGQYIADNTPELKNRDVELQAISTILHDLGWAIDDTSGIVSKDKRFEVDSANATRTFLLSKGEKGEWNEHRLQLAWDAVALHATASFAMHKELEVKCVNIGIAADFRGPENSHGGLLKRSVWEAAAKEFPRSGFKDGVKEILCGLCKTKPETTYDNWVGDFGIAFVEEYSREGKRLLDGVLATEN
jgi:hypothetical protein